MKEDDFVLIEKNGSTLRACLSRKCGISVSLLQVDSRETYSGGKAGYLQEISINRHGVV